MLETEGIESPLWCALHSVVDYVKSFICRIECGSSFKHSAYHGVTGIWWKVKIRVRAFCSSFPDLYSRMAGYLRSVCAVHNKQLGIELYNFIKWNPPVARCSVWDGFLHWSTPECPHACHLVCFPSGEDGGVDGRQIHEPHQQRLPNLVCRRGASGVRWQPNSEINVDFEDSNGELQYPDLDLLHILILHQKIASGYITGWGYGQGRSVSDSRQHMVVMITVVALYIFLLSILD